MRILAFLLLPAMGAPAQHDAAPFKRFYYAAEGARTIQSIGPDGRVEREFPAEMSRDVRRLPDGHLLFAFNRDYNSRSNDNPSGVMEVDASGRLVWQFATTGQVFSCDRMADGTTLVGAASQGRVLRIDTAGRLAGGFAVRNKGGHSCMRHVRATPDGTVLVAEESARFVREYSVEGEFRREFGIPFPPFSAVRLPGGRTVVSGREGLLEFDAEGRVVWRFAGSDFPDLGIRWCAGFEVLPTGDLLVCNAGGKVPLVRVTREPRPRVTWRWDPALPPLAIGHGVALEF
jgi:hypothetical protein